MSRGTSPMEDFADYRQRLQAAIGNADFAPVETLARAMHACWAAGNWVYLCGNGGSAANAIHLANDLVYGVADGKGPGMRAQALPANSSVLTCLANDLDYSEIFSFQIKTFCKPGDILIVLSGSGNSPNILKAIEAANELGVQSFGVLGYSGGKAKGLLGTPIHFAVDDMQIAEDLQLTVGHMIVQWLKRTRSDEG
jgi:D-sedoheptulose 7-phosphate isomerase